MSRLSVLKPPYTAFNTLLKIISIYGDFVLQTAFSTLGDNVKKIFKVSRILATGKKDKHFPFLSLRIRKMFFFYLFKFLRL